MVSNTFQGKREELENETFTVKVLKHFCPFEKSTRHKSTQVMNTLPPILMQNYKAQAVPLPSKVPGGRLEQPLCSHRFR